MPQRTDGGPRGGNEARKRMLDFSKTIYGVTSEKRALAILLDFSRLYCVGGGQVGQRVDEEIGCGASGENVLALANAGDSGSIAGDTRESGDRPGGRRLQV